MGLQGILSKTTDTQALPKKQSADPRFFSGVCGLPFYNLLIFKDLQKQYAGVCLDEFNGDVSTFGNVFFMKRTKNAKGNTLLFKEKDLPMPVGSIGVFLVTAELVEKKISHTRYLKERKKLQKQKLKRLNQKNRRSGNCLTRRR